MELSRFRRRRRVRSCRRAFFRSVASFIFSLKTRISEYSFWISGRVRSASSCWAVSFNIAAICVLWMWCMAIKSAVGKTERYSELRGGVAGNKQPALLSFFAARHCPRQVGGCRLLKMNFLTASIVRASCRGRRLRGGVTSTTKSTFSSSQQPTAMKMYFITPQGCPRKSTARRAAATTASQIIETTKLAKCQSTSRRLGCIVSPSGGRVSSSQRPLSSLPSGLPSPPPLPQPLLP
ncbi:hypothetical protein ABIB85_001258 [Bradyrhizobium sp. JR1.5]